MSSLATVNTNTLKGVKYGSTEVKKIMRGSDRLWPLFPIKMLRGGVYYDVTGIVNNEYVKTVIPDIECTLVAVKSSYDGKLTANVNVIMNFEFCGTCGDDLFFGITGGGDTQHDIEFFFNGSNLYFDYLAAYSNGTGFNRLNVTVGNNTIKVVQTDTIYIARATVEPNPENVNLFTKRLVLKYKDSETNLYNVTKNAYRPSSYVSGRQSYLPAANHNIIMYYIKVWDQDNKLLGFFHMKENNGVWMMYDEVTKSFCGYRENKSSYNHDERNVAYTDKKMYMPPIVEDYYEVSGTITEGSDTYERLVNNKTGIVLKGIKIEL